MYPYKHIVVAIDLFDGVEAIIQKAAAIALEHQAKLSLIHVVEPIPGYGYAFVAPTELENVLLDQAKKEMERLGEKHQVPKAERAVLLGSVKHEILAYAEKHHADLLVVGSHGRHGLGVLS